VHNKDALKVGKEMDSQLREDALEIINEAISVALPENAVKAALTGFISSQKIIVLAIGKAA